MTAITREENTSKIVKEIVNKGSYTTNLRRNDFAAPIAASATNILNAHAIDGSTPALLRQPDFAQQLQLVGDAGATAVIPLVGADIRGNKISENVTLNGTTPVLTVNAYKSLNNPVLPTQSSKHVSIGTTGVLGLSHCMDVDGMLKADVDGAADSALPTITSKNASIVSKNFVTLATAPNAAHNYSLVFFSNDGFVNS